MRDHLKFKLFVAVSVCLGLLGSLPLPAQRQSSQPHSAEPAAAPATISEPQPPPPTAFAGDASCTACHREQAAHYAETAHHFTSQWPGAHSVAGKFTAGSNILHTALPDLTYVMSQDQDKFLESAVMQSAGAAPITYAEPIDIVVGAGRKGQTYLFWRDDQLFELPVSYWPQSSQWTYSPGYQDGTINFDRAIAPRCLECHASFFQSLAPPDNRFNKASLTLGITCERCHGPGQKHVALYSSGAAVPAGASKAIVNLAKLSRERQLDLCSLCHAGSVKPLAPAMTFRAGDDITKFLKIPDPGPNVVVDVHGNQMELLRRSRCFRSSQMTCSTCHNVHLPQQDAAAYSPTCLSCHKAQQCGKFKTLGAQITKNCVDCHMPLQKSEVLFSELNGEELQPLVRNHQIAIYPSATLPKPASGQ
jgi:hypothetical protein